MITDIYISESFLSSNNRKQITRRKDKDDMGILKYYSMIPHDKPEWLLRLQMEVSQHYAMRGIDNTPEEWMDLLDFIDAFISQSLHAPRYQREERRNGRLNDRGWRDTSAD